MIRRMWMLCGVCGLFLCCFAATGAWAQIAPAETPSYGDESLDAAVKFVDASDRYLHHRKLTIGMKGYGLTVMKGTELVKFDVEIVSIMGRWAPHQDVIVARCSGLGLEKSGIIAGMSGSPVFVVDPADGKEKMIGAVAYGWQFPKEPLCGLQPITQMLAASGVIPYGKAAKESTANNAAAVEGGSQPLAGGRQASKEYLATFLNPEKLDFAPYALNTSLLAEGSRATRTNYGRANPADPYDASNLVPLGIPLSVSSSNPRLLADTTRAFQSLGFLAVQGGAVTPEQAQALKISKFIPGSAIAVTLVTGDADMSGTGTVTEVIGDRVLAFGHPMLGEGDTEFPIAPAYIHTIVSTLNKSFKLASSGTAIGSLDGDRSTGVFGRMGPQTKPVKMIPMTVNVEWKDEGRKETYKYNVSRFRAFAATLSRAMIAKSLTAWRNMPEHFVIRHDIEIDYGKLGKFHASDIAADNDDAVASDLTRAVAGLSANPLGKVELPESIVVNVTIEKGEQAAGLLQLKLDGRLFRPGDTVTGNIVIRPFRKDRTSVPVRIKLPETLPDGKYTLTACDAAEAMKLHLEENPQKANPRTTEQLFAALQETVSLRNDRIYLRLPLNQGGLALGTSELPDLPASRAQIIGEAGKLDTFQFSRTLVEEIKSDYVVHGSSAVSFEVQQKPRQTLLHGQVE